MMRIVVLLCTLAFCCIAIKPSDSNAHRTQPCRGKSLSQVTASGRNPPLGGFPPVNGSHFESHRTASRSSRWDDTIICLNDSGSWGARRYCHCKPCTRFRGVSPVHLLGVKPAEGESPITVTKGEQYVKMVGDLKYGSMEHAFCTECGCALFQSPKGAGFRAVSATTLSCPSKHCDDGASPFARAGIPAELSDRRWPVRSHHICTYQSYCQGA